MEPHRHISFEKDDSIIWGAVLKNPEKYKIVGGSSNGQEIVPTAPGMKRHPDARPISPTDQHPLAQAAREEAAQGDNDGFDPETVEFADGDVTFYRPKNISRRKALRSLGFTDHAIKNLTREQLQTALDDLKTK